MYRSTSIQTRFAQNLKDWFKNNRFSITTLILLVCLVAFEMFNYSTTDFALKDLLGDLKFLGFYWSTILAIAFCGIDFAGIARLFMPEEQMAEPREMWFLFAAWLLAATMNAILTWWGVSMSLVNHAVQSSMIMETRVISQFVPIFVAIMVWVTRILLIGSFSFSSRATLGISRSTKKSTMNRNTSQRTQVNPINNVPVRPQPKTAPSFQSRPASRTVTTRPEPEYVTDPQVVSSGASFQKPGSNRNNQRRF